MDVITNIFARTILLFAEVKTSKLLTPLLLVEETIRSSMVLRGRGSELSLELLPKERGNKWS